MFQGKKARDEITRHIYIYSLTIESYSYFFTNYISPLPLLSLLLKSISWYFDRSSNIMNSHNSALIFVHIWTNCFCHNFMRIIFRKGWPSYCYTKTNSIRNIFIGINSSTRTTIKWALIYFLSINFIVWIWDNTVREKESIKSTVNNIDNTSKFLYFYHC